MPVRRFLIVVTLLGISVSLTEKVFAKPGRYTAQLESECDAMLQSAVQRPYGWAWDPIGSNADPSKPRAVSMEPQASPAIGLLLQLAGETLKKPAYLDAAGQAARGVIASREENGRISPMPIFGDTVTANPDSSALPDRAATRAGLGFALVVLPNAKSKAELTIGTTISARWLVQQQSPSGAWPIASADFVEQGKPVRLARMDNPDARDCTFALLLAGEVLNDKSIALSANRAISALLQMRQPDHHNLWMITYDEKLGPNASQLQLPNDADLLSSQYAMQTLLGGYLFTGERRFGMTLDEAIRATTSLKRPDGGWDRFPGKTTGAAMAPGAGALAGETLRMGDLIDTMRQLKVLGREKYKRMLEKHFTLNEQLALAVCGLDDSPLLIDLPVTSEESTDYIRRHEAEWKTLLNQSRTVR